MIGVPLPGLLEIEADIVAGDGVGHFEFPSVVALALARDAKIAVNARGCNEAESILFVTK